MIILFFMHKKSFFLQLLDATDSVAWKIFSTLVVTAGIIVTYLNVRDGITQSLKDWVFL